MASIGLSYRNTQMMDLNSPEFAPSLPSPYPVVDKRLNDSEFYQEEDNTRRLRTAMLTELGITSIPSLTPEHFYFIKPIGEGSFSTVYIAKDATVPLDTAEAKYAIKVMPKDFIVRHDKVAAVSRERNILEHLSFYHGGHPFVNDLFAAFQDELFVYFVMGITHRGDFREFLKGNVAMKLPVARFYAAEILSALDFIHSCGIIHRDIKPENILVNMDGHIVLTDFGCGAIRGRNLHDQVDQGQDMSVDPIDVTSVAQPEEIENIQEAILDPIQIDDDSSESDSSEGEAGGHLRERRSTFVGTAQYVSPEMLRGDEVAEPCDIWAFGCILYQMLSGSPPFRAMNDYHLMKRINMCEYDFPAGFDHDAMDLIKRIFTLNPEERICIDQIKAHAFFNGVDFATLHQTQAPELHRTLPVLDVSVDLSVYEHIRAGFSHEIAAQLVELNTNLTAHTVARDLNYDLQTKLANFNFDEFMDVPDDITCSDKMMNLTREANAKRRRTDKVAKQEKENPYHLFCRGELIIQQGLMEKKKGLIARTRMFVLTEGPRLFYVRPENMEMKGEVPFSQFLECEVKDFRTFFIHTPGRTYALHDPEAHAPEWCKIIMETKMRYQSEVTAVYNRALSLNIWPAVRQDKRLLRKSEQERIKNEKKVAKQRSKDDEKAKKIAAKEEAKLLKEQQKEQKAIIKQAKILKQQEKKKDR